MISDKNAFLLFHSHEDFFDALDGNQTKKLIKAIFDYDKRGLEPDLDPITNMAFIAIRQDLDYNKKKWKETKKSRSEAGKAGGLASAGKRKKQNEAKQANVEIVDELKQKQANVEIVDERQANQAVYGSVSVYEYVYDKDNKNIVQKADAFEPHLSRNPAINDDSYPDKDNKEQAKRVEQRHRDQQAKDLFEDLWKLYPVKRGKGSVSHTQKLKLAKIGKEEMVRAIDRYKSDVESANFDLSYKNGSTFFNSGYVDYLDANYTPRPESNSRSGNQKHLSTCHRSSSEYRDFSHLVE